MKVLVVGGSKHGATLEVAGAVAAELRACGHEVEALEPQDVAGVSCYEAFVVGSAIYVGHWTKETKRFLDEHRTDLLAHPVWLFSCGPLGDPPVALEDPSDIDELVAMVGAREHRLFSGALARDGLNFVERAAVRAVRAPYGDFRDWAAIQQWAAEISDSLSSRP